MEDLHQNSQTEPFSASPGSSQEHLSSVFVNLKTYNSIETDPDLTFPLFNFTPLVFRSGQSQNGNNPNPFQNYENLANNFTSLSRNLNLNFNFSGNYDNFSNNYNDSDVFDDVEIVDPDFIPLRFTQMSPTARNCAIAYIILFIISATGNFSVFFSVLRQLKKSKSRICVLILHLSLADLMVTFFVMPIEVIWRMTVGWYGGNILCKICQFLRAFGLYLSSMVLICISLDRYFAIIHPLRTSGAKRRGRTMLACAWISAAICSIPQSVIFHVKRHPNYPSFQQCVSMDYFQNESEDIAYTVASVAIMYFLPLLVIIYTYGRIIWKINRKSRQHRESRKNLGEASGRILLRRSDASNHMERAKNRTLRLTLVIVLLFVMCWTPYAVITLWYMFDREEAKKVNLDVQEALFIMAVANSCVNPLVYGTYTKECRDSVTHCCIAETARRRSPQNHLKNSKTTISSRIMSTTGLGSGDSPPTTKSQQHVGVHGNSQTPNQNQSQNQHLSSNQNSLRQSISTKNKKAENDDPRCLCQYHSQLEKNKGVKNNEMAKNYKKLFNSKPKGLFNKDGNEEVNVIIHNDLGGNCSKSNEHESGCEGRKEGELEIIEGCPPPNVMIPLKHYRCIHQLGQLHDDGLT